MGLWIMILAALVGIFFLIVSYTTRVGHPAKKVTFILGVILIAFAIYLATPFGANYANDYF